MTMQNEMTAAEIATNIGKTPWRISEQPEYHGDIEDDNGLLVTTGTIGMEAAAIAQAVNATFGQGVDPAAIPALVEALKESRDAIMGLMEAFAENWDEGIKNAFLANHPTIKLIDAALSAATITVQ